MSKLWLVILPFFLFSFLIFPVFGSEEPFKYESINPDSLIYPLKRITEKVKFILVSGDRNRSKYNFELLNTRFNELVYIVNYKKGGFLQETVSRYNSLVGQIKKQGFVKDQDKIQKYTNILETLRDKHPANSASWLLLQQAIDTTKSIL